uniref:Major sperm protein n=1 Tax=Ascaris lumbricoides TaxID=6252 RepID=A0A0M3HUW6_ASCLU
MAVSLPTGSAAQSQGGSLLLEDEEQQNARLVSVDQTFICFDVEQLSDATEELTLSRAIGPDHSVAWRIRTNAPTRYIVNPSCGVLCDSKPVKVTIRLVRNRFHPLHKLILQATKIPVGCDLNNAWKHENIKNPECMHTIAFELSTMLMNIDYTENVGTDEVYCSKAVEDLQSIMAQSSATGSDRIKELQNLLAMLKADTQQIKMNAEQSRKLKRVLHKALDARKSMLIVLKGRLIESKRRNRRWKQKLSENEAEFENLQKLRKDYTVHQCCIS